MENAPISSPERFDQIRAENPDLAMALYAYEPRGPVTLEIITPEADAAPYQFIGATAEEAMAKAFPTMSEIPTPDPTPEPTDTPAPAASVFD